MIFPRPLRFLFATSALAVFAGCKEGTAPIGPPSQISASSSTSQTGLAGSRLTEPLVVKVADSRGKPVPNASVEFAVTRGGGTVDPRVTKTDASGVARATWTLGTSAGANEVTARVEGLDAEVKFLATADAGPVTAIAVSPKTLRLPVGTETGRIIAQSVDQFGNPSSPTPTLVVRDPTLVSVAADGAVRVLRRGGTTWVIASNGTLTDSALVIVLAPGDPACTGFPVPAALAVGQVVTTGFSDAGICIGPTSSSAEYAIMPYYTATPPSLLGVEAVGTGIRSPGALGVMAAEASPFPLRATPSPDDLMQRRRDDHHAAMRDQEEREMALRMAGARGWRPPPAEQSAIPANVAVGDLIQLNVDAVNFCANPDFRTGRVVAITDRAVVIADTANPTGGFTNDEYRDFGVTFDTLIYPLNVANFGEPSDIDNNNKRVGILFTRAVNAMSVSGAVVLGFYYSRDLLPRSGPLGSCPGSNVAEIFYLRVPDPNGGNNSTKDYVRRNTLATVAHEFQHLINASRRMYVNNAPTSSEERWLNEGLSHIAEELTFYRVTGLAPRQNLGTVLQSPVINAVAQQYVSANFGRFRSFLSNPHLNSPFGRDAQDDALATRGGSWAFLRYVADQRFTTGETNFWFRLVNAQTTGLTNLNAVLGSDARALARDWYMSILLDDLVPTAAPYQQPSWHFRTAFPILTSLPYPPTVGAGHVPLQPDIRSSTSMVANSATYFRFGTNASQEAFVTVTSAQGPLPGSVQLALVRTR